MRKVTRRTRRSAAALSEIRSRAAQFEIAWRTFENHLKTTHADHMQNGALIRKLDNMRDGARARAIACADRLAAVMGYIKV